jgi:uncharacterized coiled-coil protein SlyX
MSNPYKNKEINNAIKEPLPLKIQYHYGNKKSSTPSIFKKFQPPFHKNEAQKPSNPDINLNVEEIIISLLENNKKNTSGHQTLDKNINDNGLDPHKMNNDVFKINEKNTAETAKISNLKGKTTMQKFNLGNLHTHDKDGEESDTPENLNNKNSNNKYTSITNNPYIKCSTDENKNKKEKENITHNKEMKTNPTITFDTETTPQNEEDKSYAIKTPNDGTIPYTETSSNNISNPSETRIDTPITNPKPTLGIITPNTHTPMANPYIKNKDETNPFQKAQNHYAYQNLKSNSKNNSVITDSITNDLLKQSIINKINREDIINPYKHIAQNIPTSATKTYTSPQKNTKNIQTSANSHIKIPNLTPELESLRTVIMSQHNAFSQHIIDLGTICLKHTTTIEKKKESSLKLINEEIIPRSLRIKCDLTTSPDFENNPNYITLKKDLQTAVSNFISTGMEIMKKWSITNVDLLIKDRCNNFMKKAIKILDGLYSYWENIIGPAKWTNDIKTNILLLMLKIYIETDYIPNTIDVANFLEMPPNEILLLCSKIITKNPDDIYNQSILVAIDQIQLDISEHNSEQLYILQETLTAFDAIIRATTLQLWQTHSILQREIEASQKLKAQMEAERTLSATEATAKAVNKAIATIELTNNTNQATELRIHNLEKQLTEQKQTANEILNHIRKQQNRKSNEQTNPLTQAFTSKKRNEYKNTMVSTSNEQNREHYIHTQKKRRIIQWDNDGTTITEYNPTSTPLHTFSHSPLLYPQKQNLLSQNSINTYQINSIVPQTNQNQTPIIPTQNLNPFTLAPPQPNQTSIPNNPNRLRQFNQMSAQTQFHHNLYQNTNNNHHLNQTQIQPFQQQNNNGHNNNPFQLTAPQPFPFQSAFPQQNTLQTNTPFTLHNHIRQNYRGGKYRGGKRDSIPRR